MSSSLVINHDGVIHSSVYIPIHKELPRIPNASPKKSELLLERHTYEKEEWYVVSDGIIITRR
jgi:hypothetical protein